MSSVRVIETMYPGPADHPKGQCFSRLTYMAPAKTGSEVGLHSLSTNPQPCHTEPDPLSPPEESSSRHGAALQRCLEDRRTRVWPNRLRVTPTNLPVLFICEHHSKRGRGGGAGLAMACSKAPLTHLKVMQSRSRDCCHEKQSIVHVGIRIRALRY